MTGAGALRRASGDGCVCGVPVSCASSPLALGTSRWWKTRTQAGSGRPARSGSAAAALPAGAAARGGACAGRPVRFRGGAAEARLWVRPAMGEAGPAAGPAAGPGPREAQEPEEDEAAAPGGTRGCRAGSRGGIRVLKVRRGPRPPPLRATRWGGGESAAGRRRHFSAATLVFPMAVAAAGAERAGAGPGRSAAAGGADARSGLPCRGTRSAPGAGAARAGVGLAPVRGPG